MKRLVAVAAVAILTIVGMVVSAADEPIVEHTSVLTGEDLAAVAGRLCPNSPPAQLGDLQAANPWASGALPPGAVLHYHPAACTTPAIATAEEPATTEAPTTADLPVTTAEAETSATATDSTLTTPEVSSPAEFVATFDTPEDFYERFHTDTGNYAEPGRTYRPEQLPDYVDHIVEFQGDHNHNCEGPDSVRTIDVTNHANFFWWCAPAGPESGHVMVAQDVRGYAITAFSPKQSFTDVRQVCWDLSMADLGGGKWFNVVLVPEDVYLSHPNTNPTAAAEGEGPYQLDYTSPGFNDDDNPGDFNIQGFQTFGLKMFRGELSLWTDNSSDQFVFESFDGWTNGGDKAARFKHCMTDNGDGTITITQQRATETRTYTAQASMPDGPVQVIFQDDTYDSVKHGGIAGYKTWHVDNIIIDVE